VPEDPDLRRQLMQEPHDQLVAMLRRASPDLCARTDLGSTRRVIRALEIAAWEERHETRYSAPLGMELEFAVFALAVDRPELHRRIERRLSERLEQGMVDEVRDLLDRGLPGQRLQALGMEYREIAAFLDGGKGYQQMVSDLGREIRHLAKRQQTYLRGMARRGIPVHWIAPDEGDRVPGIISRHGWTRSRPAESGDP
jgi:tRNA dimethylallyltransferase